MLERACLSFLADWAQSAKKDKKKHRSSSSESGSDDSDVILERKLKKLRIKDLKTELAQEIDDEADLQKKIAVQKAINAEKMKELSTT